jgi:hypothetical protein
MKNFLISLGILMFGVCAYKAFPVWWPPILIFTGTGWAVHALLWIRAINSGSDALADDDDIDGMPGV